MSRWILSTCFMGAVALVVLVTPPAAISKEDTAYISFKRAGVSRHHADPYTVKKDEHLFGIIREHYDVSGKDIYRILELVKRFNPRIKDMNVLYPGQKLFLPRKRTVDGSFTGGSPPTGLPDQKTDEDSFAYVVKKGDSISFIINRFGNSYGEIYRVLEQVKRLNPTVKDFDTIFPGQVLHFPSSARKDIQPPVEERNISIPDHEVLPVISAIMSRMQEGTVITEGSYCIPVTPSGEITIDCSKVPVIEIPGGNTIFLDLSNRMPGDLKKIIGATWNTYRVLGVREDETISSILERIWEAAGVYSLEKINRRMQIGTTPDVHVLIDWIVSRRSESGSAVRYAFNFVTEASHLFPLPVRTYAWRNGMEIIEIMDGRGVEGDDAVYQSSSVPVLDSASGLILAESLLRMLGYSPVTGSEITVLSGDGLSLSMKTELLLDRGGRRVIMTSQQMSDQFLNALTQRGDRVVLVSGERGKKEIIEDILRAIDIPALRDDFTFSLSRQTGKERGHISLSSLRVSAEKELYLIDYDVDTDIQALLQKEWNVTLVRY